jgi:DnaJ-domain-containing protein 1
LLDRETVLTVLRHQLVRKLIALFDLSPETRYAYFEGVNLLEIHGGPELLECEPLAVIMAGVRLHADHPVVDATLDRIAHRPLGLHLDAEVKRFQLHRDEAAVVDLLRTRRMTLPDVISAGVAQERVVRLTVYALAITRHLDLGVPGRGPVGIGRERPASPLIEAGSVAVREAQRGQPRAGPPASSPGTPIPRTTRSVPSAADEVVVRGRPGRDAAAPGRSPPVVTITGPGDDAPPPSRRAGAPAAEGAEPRAPGSAAGDSVAMPRTSDVRSPTSPRTLASPGARPGGKPQAKRVRGEAAEGAQGGPGAGAQARGPERPAQEAAPASARAPGRRQPAGAPPDEPALPPPPQIAARRAEIEARAAAMDGETFYEMLGVTPDAPPERVRTAYFGLAKQWHPDRVPADLDDVKPAVARVFARISEAYQTLSDPARRAEYERAREEGLRAKEAEEQKVARAVDAVLEIQKAEILLKKRDLPGAEALARRAVEADPEQPEYLTLLVWIQAQRRADPPPFPEGGITTHYDDLIEMLDAILEEEPQYERALFYRGMLLKRSGRLDKALHDFQLVAELNPRNIEAVREVRLHQMRKRGGPHEPPPPQGGGGGGLFGKIFKR